MLQKMKNSNRFELFFVSVTFYFSTKIVAKPEKLLGDTATFLPAIARNFNFIAIAQKIYRSVPEA